MQTLAEIKTGELGHHQVEKDGVRAPGAGGFEGVGHGPSKPKSSRAVMQHNLEWFDQYIWGLAPAPSK